MKLEDARDKVLGAMLREEAIARVTAHASAIWLAKACDAACEVGSMFGTFTTDDIWVLLAKRCVPRPHEPRAMVGVIRRLQGEERIVKASEKPRQSELPRCHRRPKQVWTWLR